MSNCKYNRPVLSALLKGRRDMSLLIPVLLVGCGLFLICETAPVQNENRHAMVSEFLVILEIVFQELFERKKAFFRIFCEIRKSLFEFNSAMTI